MSAAANHASCMNPSDSPVMQDAHLRYRYALESCRALISSHAAALSMSGTAISRREQLREQLPAAAMLGLALLSASVVSREAFATDSTQVLVQARVMRHASIAAVHAPRSITISAEDVERGFVDLDEPIEVAIRSNAPEGFLLGLALRSIAVQAVQLRGEAGSVRVSRLGATLPVARQGSGQGLVSQLVSLRARLELGSAARPGPIAFPIQLFVSPN